MDNIFRMVKSESSRGFEKARRETMNNLIDWGGMTHWNIQIP